MVLGQESKEAMRLPITLLALTVACGALACAAPPPEVPPAIQGRWTTEAGDYEGRAMSISSDSIEFETGIEAPSRHRITEVETRDDAEGRLEIAITYEGEGSNEYTMTLVHDPADASLRLANRSAIVWRKDGEA